MNEVVFILWFLATTAGSVALARRWPVSMRDLSRALALAVGAAILALGISGLAQGSPLMAEVHRWLAHGLFLAAWSVIPLAVGFNLAQAPARPILAMARSLGLLLLLAILFLASITGYSPPPQGGLDDLSLLRFRLLHFGLLPCASLAMVAWWYHEPIPDRAARTSFGCEGAGEA